MKSCNKGVLPGYYCRYNFKPLDGNGLIFSFLLTTTYTRFDTKRAFYLTNNQQHYIRSVPNQPVSHLPLNNWKYLAAGIGFAILWASASAATKIGLTAAQPFVIAVSRFFIAGAIMLTVTHGIQRNRLPAGEEWRQLIVYGLFNISLYLGLYIVAMQNVSAGLGSLAVAANPVFIALIAAGWLSHAITFKHIFSLLLCFTGVMVAAWPLLLNSFASPAGIGLLVVSMVFYSIGTIYYSRVQWNGLAILTINGWQTIIGGLFLVPALLLTYHPANNQFGANFWKSVGWLAIPVSIGAVQLWLYLISRHPVKAAYWLFICPIIGFAIAAALMKEPITWFTLVGVLLVLGGLYMVQKRN